jgi:hypothetical protein
VIDWPPLAGDLRIEERLDEELRRYVRFARLFDVGDVRPGRTLPELLDVRLVVMSSQAFTLTGFERVGDAAYAHSWLVAAGERKAGTDRRLRARLGFRTHRIPESGRVNSTIAPPAGLFRA